jgi:hypothetical protein
MISSYISEHTRTLRRTMPTFDGAICDPRLVPAPYRAEYLARWGQWLREHPNDWEPWHKDLVAQIKREKAKHAR